MASGADDGGVRETRAAVLREAGARGAVLDELLAYNENVFELRPEYADAAFPLDDEPFVEAWERYAAAAAQGDALAALAPALRQLRFPVRAGMSEDPDYRAVATRGRAPDECAAATGIDLRSPGRVRVRLEATPGGRVPVVVVGDRDDFEDVLRALLHRNEPVAIPAALGAMMVAGYNNWDRIDHYQREWVASHSSLGWPAERKRLFARKELYQDRFVLVSEGPYSNVSAAALGLEEDEWRRLSLDVRIHHECAHYFTKRILGTMRNNLLDEIIADYMGIVGAIGRYRCDWFLHFVGLGDDGGYREGARLEHYRGDPPLSGDAFAVLQAVVRLAAAGLERFDAGLRARGESGTAGRLLLGLTRLTVEELAAGDADDRLAGAMAAR